ncbi:hypothetical protein EDC04DRAFT_2609983 [Pisolithus marmoratus]|nr:hypothetical protein EDC04DRAFT_2609983 [Pisolithus marmoratus]
MENEMSFCHGLEGSSDGSGNMHAKLNTGSCNSPTPMGLLPLDHEERGSAEHSNTTGTDVDIGSCNSPTPKARLFGHEQRGSIECGDTSLAAGSCNSPTLKAKLFGHEQRGSIECSDTVGSCDSPTLKEKSPGHGQGGLVACSDDVYVCLATGGVEVSLPSGTIQVPSIAVPEHVTGGSLASQSTTNIPDTLSVPWCNSPVASSQDLHLRDNNIDLDEMFDCYELFKKEYHDMWQEILVKFEESMQYTETGKTVSQWQQLFNKSVKRFTQSFTALSKVHAIEAAFVMAGSVVNQDASLGYVYTNPSVEDFFMEHCRADTNAIIRHFKAHIYNRSSLACVTDTFHTDKLDQKGKAKDCNDMGCDILDLTSDNDGVAPDNGSDE